MEMPAILLLEMHSRSTSSRARRQSFVSPFLVPIRLFDM